MTAVKVETLRAAQEWDKTKAHYLRQGLCHRCAAQAAYGHADGFSAIKPPCSECAPTIATLPTPKANGWRAKSLHYGRKTYLNIPGRQAA